MVRLDVKQEELYNRLGQDSLDPLIGRMWGWFAQEILIPYHPRLM